MDSEMNNKERFSRSINKHNLVKRITFPLCQPVFPSHQHLLRRFESEPKISILPNIVKKNEKTHTNKSKTAYITAISSVPYQDNKRISKLKTIVVIVMKCFCFSFCLQLKEKKNINIHKK